MKSHKLSPLEILPSIPSPLNPQNKILLALVYVETYTLQEGEGYRTVFTDYVYTYKKW